MEKQEKASKILAFRVPETIHNRLMSRRKIGETKSVFLRRVVDKFLKYKN